MQARPALVQRTARVAVGLLGFGLALSACGNAPSRPLTLPPADGRATSVVLGSHHYDVGRQQGTRGVFLRVTRADGPDLDYSDGLVAKEVATRYCDVYHRLLNPTAMGRFSVPASWIFEEGCQ